MRAVVCTKYGPPEVLEFREVPKPIPNPNEVLIKVYATTAHYGDTRIRRVDPFFVRLMFGLFRPRKNLILGIEISGVIEELGDEDQPFKVGDEIFALTGYGMGGYADYCCLPVDLKGNLERRGLVGLKPKNLSFAEAATVPAAGLTVLKNFEKAKAKAGESILINGASGSLGTYAIQYARYLGMKVTAVCSAKNFELVRSLGADDCIDYRTTDFTKANEKFDVVYDAVMKSSRHKCKGILHRNGRFVNNFSLPKTREADLTRLREMIRKGHIKPVIDRSYPIEEVVEAHRYVDTQRKKGNVPLVIHS